MKYTNRIISIGNGMGLGTKGENRYKPDLGDFNFVNEENRISEIRHFI